MKILGETPEHYLRDATIRHLAGAAGELQRRVARLERANRALERQVKQLEERLGIRKTRGPYAKAAAAKAGGML